MRCDAMRARLCRSRRKGPDRVQRQPGYLWLFLLLALLYLVPLWSVRYLPTLDGPCHVYTAWAMHAYGDQAAHPLLARYFFINWKPVPELAGPRPSSPSPCSRRRRWWRRSCSSASTSCCSSSPSGIWPAPPGSGAARSRLSRLPLRLQRHAAPRLLQLLCLGVALFLLVVGYWGGATGGSPI